MAANPLEAIAFPTLTDEQIASLAECTHAALRCVKAGETLFKVGDRDFKFFVVKSGEVEIIDSSGEAPQIVTVHQPGSFTGDVSHLGGTSALVTGRAKTDCEVYEVTPERLRHLLNQCPELSDIILQAFIARRQLLRQWGKFTGLRVIGSRYSKDTFRIRDFLAKNRVPFTWLDLETEPQVEQLLKQFGLTEDETPVVSCAHRVLQRNPTNRQLAEILGIHHVFDETVYDFAIVGAGPAGLAAAVYAASEGLSTVLFERTAPGGQAGASMRIENYLGFPTGITGSELTDRAVMQANKFGAVLTVPSSVAHLSFDSTYPVLTMEDGQNVVAKCLLIASGAEYRRLMEEGCEQFEGCGVYYAATHNEAQICRGSDVVVVGGGNSAGQAVVFLASQVNRVYLVVRGDSLYKSMSSYLAHRIEQNGSVEVLLNTRVRRMSGDGHLVSVDLIQPETGEERTIETPALFSFIGASPRTDWLPPEIETDSKGFIRTGTTVTRLLPETTQRKPFLLETSRRGVFAAGDVRSGSTKRVASAVGEGAMVVQFVHEYLKEV